MTSPLVDVSPTLADLTGIIEHAITNTPRTLQTRIGPSSLGNPCDPCLIAELGGLQPPDGYAPWLPTIGTAVHEWLEATLINHLATSGSDRWIPEGHVTVGTIDGQPITGHSDLYDTHTGTVVDYKVVGTMSLRTARAEGPKLTYQRQAHLYGRGWVNAGYDVRNVAIWYLPRNGIRVGDGLYWEVPYDEQVALDALARADMFAAAIRVHGAETVLAMAGPHTGTEFSCPKDPKDVPATADAFLGIK